MNLVLGLSISFGTHVIGSGINIDNMAHVGGFTCGLLLRRPWCRAWARPGRCLRGGCALPCGMWWASGAVRLLPGPSAGPGLSRLHPDPGFVQEYPRTAPISIHFQEASHEASRIFEASRHHCRSRCICQPAGGHGHHPQPIARRTLGRTGEKLSIIGFGGIVVMNEEAEAAKNIVAEAVDRGVNYFDVAPSYGNAQERLGPALEPYRNKSFLACKTDGRMKDDSRAQLEESLRLLKTDHVDLYQFHALTKMTELDKVLGPGGAMETMEAAKKEGKIRFIGFTVHSAETALAAHGPVQLRYDSVSAELGAVYAGRLRAADSEEGAGKEDGHSGAEEHGEDGVAGGREGSSRAQVLVSAGSFPDEASLGLRWTLGHRDYGRCAAGR